MTSSLAERDTFYVRDSPGGQWHIEGPEVDVMLCGVIIAVDLDSCEVRTRRPVRVCEECMKC